ncbi:MAG: glycosyltransferase [Bacteroides sp.]|nr:glycosyltransferase [Bacteroides sp.]
MKNIAISVIVPVYGVEKYIERCVRSLFGQTLTDGVEFIFVNDCTKDRSIELLSACIECYPQLRSQIRIINHLKNRGLAATRQTGFDAARGEYILHLDSDDYFEPDMLDVMYEAALAKDADVVVSDYFFSFRKVEKLCECPLYDNKVNLLKSIIAPWRYGNKTIGSNVWNKLTKRSIYKKHNITSIEGINVGEDLIITIQTLYYANVITKVDRAFVHYNQQNIVSYSHDKSASNTRQRLGAIEIAANFLSKRGIACDEEFDERRFIDKLLAIANCDRDSVLKFLTVYPWLDYEKHKHLVAPYWRLPYKFALQGKIGMFIFLRNLISPIRKAYRLIYDR